MNNNVRLSRSGLCITVKFRYHIDQCFDGWEQMLLHLTRTMSFFQICAPRPSLWWWLATVWGWQWHWLVCNWGWRTDAAAGNQFHTVITRSHYQLNHIYFIYLFAQNNTKREKENARLAAMEHTANLVTMHFVVHVEVITHACDENKTLLQWCECAWTIMFD